MLDASFASRLGRADLSREVLRRLPAGSTTTTRETGLVTAGATASVGSASAGVMLDSGKLTALAIGGVVVVLAAFNWWTRGHQA